MYFKGFNILYYTDQKEVWNCTEGEL